MFVAVGKLESEERTLISELKKELYIWRRNRENTDLHLWWDLCDGPNAVVVGEVVLVEQNPLRQTQFMSFCSVSRQTVNLSHVFIQQHEVIPRAVHISGDLKNTRQMKEKRRPKETLQSFTKHINQIQAQNLFKWDYIESWDNEEMDYNWWLY